MWMCDKAIIQVNIALHFLFKIFFWSKNCFFSIKEEINERICNLIDSFNGNDEQAMLFVKVYFVTIIREWNGIDKWRIDKFMMVIFYFDFIYFFNYLFFRFIRWWEQCLGKHWVIWARKNGTINSSNNSIK